MLSRKTPLRRTPLKRTPFKRKAQKAEVKRIEDAAAPGGYREVCTGDEWDKRRAEVWLRDKCRCVKCGRRVPLHNEKDEHGEVVRRAAEIHHRSNRKMGGGSRDDRAENLETTCGWCHAKEH